MTAGTKSKIRRAHDRSCSFGQRPVNVMMKKTLTAVASGQNALAWSQKESPSAFPADQR